jgi:dihydroorotate dehydrogenase (fumarate)
VSGREVEERYVDILQAVKRAVTIPVAVKLGPYFSSTGDMAMKLVAVGADGLVLFNRFYEPDIDLAQLELLPNLELSTAAEIRLPLLWIGVLSGRMGDASLAASTGVEGPDEVIKYLLAGADVVMTTSALLKHGPAHMKVLVEGLANWLDARDLDTILRIRGSMSQRNIIDKTAFARANYIKVLQGY